MLYCTLKESTRANSNTCRPIVHTVWFSDIKLTGFGTSMVPSRINDVIPKPLDKRVGGNGKSVVEGLCQLPEVVLDVWNIQVAMQSLIPNIPRLASGHLSDKGGKFAKIALNDLYRSLIVWRPEKIICLLLEVWLKFAHSLEAMKSNQVVIDASEDKLEEKTSSIIELISEMAEAVNYRNKAENEQLNDQLDPKETTPDDNVSTDNVSNKNHDSESTEAVITDSEVGNSVSGEEASCGADYAGLCSGGDKDSPVPREHDVTAPIDEVSPQKHGTNELKGVVKNSQAAKKNSFSKLPSYIVDSLTEVQEEGETEENRMNGRLFEMGTNEATLLDETMNTTNRISESEDHTVSSILSIISEVKDAGSVKRQMKHINAIKSCIVENVAQMTGKPLQHIRFLNIPSGTRCLALGSSVYPNFCAFGHYMDHLLARLGGKRLLKVAEGDEMKGQRRAFRKWVAEVFPAACEAFNVEGDSQFIKETFSSKLSMDTVRFVKAKQHQLDHALSKYHNKKVSICQLLRKTNLHSSDTSRSTLLLELDAGQEIQYQPGDHVGVFPCNRKDIVDGVLSRLTIRVDLDVPVQVQVLKANNTSNGMSSTNAQLSDYHHSQAQLTLATRHATGRITGSWRSTLTYVPGVVKTWEPHDTVPSCSLRTLLTWFLDITTPLAPIQLENLASVATDPEEQRRLLQLATVGSFHTDTVIPLQLTTVGSFHTNTVRLLQLAT
ncbi:unnamed protein product, partial [Timema podura]|nr:unnamed protein product [Timema podura]